MATTKSLVVNPNEPIQGGKVGGNGKDENGHVVEWGSPLLTLPTLALANILDITELPTMDDLEIQEIGSNSEQVGSSQHKVSKKEKSERSSSWLYKLFQETHKEVYDVDHRFIIHIWDKMERDGSINLSMVVPNSPIFEVLEHIMWEEEKSNSCSLFCISTGPWDGPSKLKKCCTTIW